MEDCFDTDRDDIYGGGIVCGFMPDGYQNIDGRKIYGFDYLCKNYFSIDNN